MKTKHVDLWYPRNSGLDRPEDEPQVIEIGLMDVRAASDIRVSYDFDRDGYVVTQQPEYEGDDYEQGEAREWREVAFVPAWLEGRGEEGG